MSNNTIAQTEISSIAPQVGTRDKLIQRVGLIIGILLLLAQCFRLFGFVHDDAFITYRYAANLLHGHGPVFNPGEHTEGFSCPLYMFVTSLLMILPGDPLFRAKLLGILFSVIAVIITQRLAQKLSLPSILTAALPVLIGLNSTIALSSVDGMETTFQMMLVTGAAYTIVRDFTKGPSIVSALWLAAVALNRPEGALFLLAGLVPLIGNIRRDGFCRAHFTWLSIVFGPTFLYEVFRMIYFGYPMPNTYYAKNVSITSALERGPFYLLRTIFVNLNERLHLGAFSVLLWLGALGGGVNERMKGPNIILPLFVLSQAIFAFRSSGDWMQGWRYMMAVCPLWMILVLLGIVEPMSHLVRGGKNKIAAACGISWCAVIGLGCLVAAPEFSNVEEGSVSWSSLGYPTNSRGLLKNFRMENTIISAEFLNKTVPAGSTIAFSEMGATPYFTPTIKWLDTYGLTDAEIAHLTGVNRFRTGVTGDYKDDSTELGRHIRDRKPDYVMQWQKQNFSQPTILGGQYEAFAKTPLKGFDGNTEMYLHLWKRRGSK